MAVDPWYLMRLGSCSPPHSAGATSRPVQHGAAAHETAVVDMTTAARPAKRRASGRKAELVPHGLSRGWWGL